MPLLLTLKCQTMKLRERIGTQDLVLWVMFGAILTFSIAAATALTFILTHRPNTLFPPLYTVAIGVGLLSEIALAQLARFGKMVEGDNFTLWLATAVSTVLILLFIYKTIG